MRLSAGQRQRLAIARALVGDPPILLLDEPSSNLDREAEHELHRALKELGRQRTVVIVTHSPILLSACGTIVALENGRVALAGPAAEILPRLLGRSRAAPEPSAETAALHPRAPSQRRPEAPADRAAGGGGR
jgi:ABC-type bacteriocin/lantibiotic exporter with double-glycine peptidase domain